MTLTEDNNSDKIEISVQHETLMEIDSDTKVPKEETTAEAEVAALEKLMIMIGHLRKFQCSMIRKMKH